MGRLIRTLTRALTPTLILLLGQAAAAVAAQAYPLSLDGYAGADGAISVQHQGDTIDPYFALQALLLAHEFGLDAGPYARRWADWLVSRQKPDATFDRFCRAGPVWAPCKTADADDTLLALWLKLLDTMPEGLAQSPVWRKSRDSSVQALQRLIDPQRGVYLVSPVYPHALFMDNLEVLSYSQPCQRDCGQVDARRRRLERSIHDTFWNPDTGRFLVSTQPGQLTVAPTFYPEYVAQLYPMLFSFKLQALDQRVHYRDWMRQHRASWLSQSKTDFAWGLVAIVALKARDFETAGCWLRYTAGARGSAHWIVTDEVVHQILRKNKVSEAASDASCR